MRVIESWGLGPTFHLGSVLACIYQAEHQEETLLPLQTALQYLECAVDSYEPCALGLSLHDVDQAATSWGLNHQLRDVVRYLVRGQWVAAHLLLSTELASRVDALRTKDADERCADRGE